MLEKYVFIILEDEDDLSKCDSKGRYCMGNHWYIYYKKIKLLYVNKNYSQN